jgi:hypothetical protein
MFLHSRSILLNCEGVFYFIAQLNKQDTEAYHEKIALMLAINCHIHACVSRRGASGFWAWSQTYSCGVDHLLHVPLTE